MATKRFGYLDDLSLKNTKVGIGTSTANEKLEVLGGTRGGGAVVTGIATLTSYSGFQNTKTSYVENISINSGESGTLSGEVVIGAGLTMSVGTGATTGQGSIESLKVSNTFIPPSGLTADRPTAPKPGALFYNKDIKTIEYWDGNFWRQVDNTTRRGRGVMGGGGEPGTSPYNYASNKIDYLEIATLGDSISFGNLSLDTRHIQAVASETRGIFHLGITEPGAHSNILEYVTIASTGNSIDFGDRGTKGYSSGSCCSSTRGIWGGGHDPSARINNINYVQIMTLGDAVEFGDLTSAKHSLMSTVSSPTRGLFAGGSTSSGDVSTIDTIIMASTGNAIDFGDLTAQTQNCTGASNSVRAFFVGGYTGAGNIRDMQNLIIASGGNAVYFGDLQRIGSYHKCLASQTRGIITSGSPSIDTRLQYIEIASTGNALYFGDLSYNSYEAGTLSDTHGGLGGF